MPYDVRFTPEAQRHLNRLPEKIRTAMVEFITGPLVADPRRIGKPLRGELEGLLSARREDYRVIYEIDERAGLLIVHRAQHRREAYRRR